MWLLIWPNIIASTREAERTNKHSKGRTNTFPNKSCAVLQWLRHPKHRVRMQFQSSGGLKIDSYRLKVQQCSPHPETVSLLLASQLEFDWSLQTESAKIFNKLWCFCWFSFLDQFPRKHKKGTGNIKQTVWGQKEQSDSCKTDLGFQWIVPCIRRMEQMLINSTHAYCIFITNLHQQRDCSGCYLSPT